uniref:receptor-like serine/threonine-protein kinase SD1-8 n=1 Tax=Fragaria vesca subsp. vesca TaxID=101020 RepID=UPI0005C9DEEB
FPFCCYACLKTHGISLAADTISASQSLSGDQTIVSAGGKFELGFFRPGNTSNYYIGIWYYKQNVSVQTIVWVANREQPLSDRFSSKLRISYGNLVLMNESKLAVWSTNLSSTTTTSGSVEAVLLDDGNLVLRAGSSSSDFLWQSFDHPANTWLPGSKLGFNNVTKQTRMLTSWKNDENPAPGLFSLQLDPNGSNSLIIMLNKSRQYWSSGSWDDSLHTFSSSPEMSPYSMFNYSHVTSENESYFTYSVYDPNETSRLLLRFSGQVWQLTNQSLVWSRPNVYAYCGAFSTYGQNQSPFCTCLSGFKPKSQREWYFLQDYSGGCSRTTLNCRNGTTEDQFIQMPSMPLSAYQQPQVGSVEECESICLSMCGCTAYVCNKRSLVIAIVSAVAGFLTIICSYFLWKKTTRKRRKRERKYGEITRNVGGKNDTELPVFDLKSILAATEDFSVANKLGEGGFGPVYKGTLPGNQTVAIKMLSKKSGQGHQEFMNELKLIAKLQHTNLVKLLGCCIEEEERILIYEYMPNRSLDKFLFDPSEKTKLDWNRRLRIIEGIGQGLVYIHKYSRLKVIHRDLKASNVLLDEAMNPKISDFGMARIFDINQTEANTNRVVGTYGYMSPEYARYGHFSEKSDIFSFGVLLLEIISGKKNAALHRYENSLTLAGWAWKLWKKGRGMEVIDESVRETCRPHEALRCIHVGFLCVQEDPADRPTMFSVVHMLQADQSATLPPFKEPAFSTHKKSSAASSSSQTPTVFSANQLTISILEGR